MRLLTKAIRNKIPNLGIQEKVKDPIVHVKFFDPVGGWTWYATEFDGEDTFFGLVKGFEDEWGYFSLSELQSIKLRYGLGIERDLHFIPTPISKIKIKNFGMRGD